MSKIVEPLNFRKRENRLVRRGWFGSTGRPIRDFVMAFLDLSTLFLLLWFFLFHGLGITCERVNISVVVDQSGNILSVYGDVPSNYNFSEVEDTIKDKLSESGD